MWSAIILWSYVGFMIAPGNTLSRRLVTLGATALEA
jgi:hypothetical protein